MAVKKEFKEFKEHNDKGTQSGGGGSERRRSQGDADGAGWWFLRNVKTKYHVPGLLRFQSVAGGSVGRVVTERNNLNGRCFYVCRFPFGRD